MIATLVIKHKEFEYGELLNEKDRALRELQELNDFHLKEEIQNVVKKNKKMLDQQVRIARFRHLYLFYITFH